LGFRVEPANWATELFTNFEAGRDGRPVGCSTESGSHKELAERLARLGETIDDRVLANRVNRGGFDAGFLTLLLDALGTPNLEVTELHARLRARALRPP